MIAWLMHELGGTWRLLHPDTSPRNPEIKAFVCNLDVFVWRLKCIAHRAVIKCARMQVEAGDYVSLLFVYFTKCLYKAIRRHVSCHVAFKRQSLFSLLLVSLFDTSFSLTLLAIMLVSNNYLTHRQQTRIGWWQMFREGLACALTFQWGWITLLWTLTRPPRQLQPDCSFPVSGDRWQCGLVSTPPPQSPTDVAFRQPQPADSCLQLENQASICLSFCPINRHVCLLSKQQLYTILSRWDQFLPLSIS